MKTTNIFAKIKAFFNFKGKEIKMNLSSAEVNQEKVFLHPVDDPDHTYYMKTKSVHIFIDPEEELQEDDITIINRKTPEQKEEEIKVTTSLANHETQSQRDVNHSSGERGIDWKRHNEKLKKPIIKKRNIFWLV